MTEENQMPEVAEAAVEAVEVAEAVEAAAEAADAADAADAAKEPLFPEFRWRMNGAKLPLYERHLRCLRNFGVSSPLQAWIRSRLEWTLDNLAYEKPDHIIVIAIHDDDNVDVTLEAPREMPRRGCLRHLIGWGRHFKDNHETCDGYCLREFNAEALLWLVQDGHLVPCGEPRSACNTLLRDLAVTLRIPVDEPREVPALNDEGEVAEEIQEAFIVDDEFGIMPCTKGEDSEIVARLVDCFNKLWTSAK